MEEIKRAAEEYLAYIEAVFGSEIWERINKALK